MIIYNYRNIGICAHIDAGKTTITERILYCTGKSYKLGEVHKGNTVMDFMDQEQERGITINSAVTTVFWKKKSVNYKINIIDTPGHVDFSVEVQRSMRVLEGVCLICCAVSGIQAQTEVIWKQLTKYSIPFICFINKLDRNGSNYDLVCDQIRKKFNTNIIKLHYPIYKDGDFIGVIDIIDMKYYHWNSNNMNDYNVITIPSIYINKIKLLRQTLVEDIVYNNEYLTSKYLDNKLSDNDILLYIRELTISKKIIPIVCGSSLKNKCIQLLLDSIVQFLPSPLERRYIISDDKDNKILLKDNNDFYGFIFKIVNDIFLGRLFYIRIYSGILSIDNKVLYNTTQGKKVRFSKIFFIHADKKIESNIARSGDIIALTGIEKASTGDTLSSLDSRYSFEKIIFSEPVISVTIKPLLKSEQQKLISYIKKNSQEDPSIKYRFNKKNSDIIISGLGELHLEVFIEKLRRDSKIKLFKSYPRVFYKETISKSSLNIEGKYIKQSGGRGQYGHVILNVFPKERGKGNSFVNSIKGGSIPNEYIKPIEKSFMETCEHGFFGYKVTDIKIELIGGTFHEVDSSEYAFKIASSIALKKALENSIPIILEPIMKLNLIFPEEFMGGVISNLYSKRGKILKSFNEKGKTRIISLVPLSEVLNYSTVARSLTKGRIDFDMDFFCYKKVSKQYIKHND